MSSVKRRGSSPCCWVNVLLSIVAISVVIVFCIALRLFVMRSLIESSKAVSIAFKCSSVTYFSKLLLDERTSSIWCSTFLSQASRNVCCWLTCSPKGSKTPGSTFKACSNWELSFSDTWYSEILNPFNEAATLFWTCCKYLTSLLLESSDEIPAMVVSASLIFSDTVVFKKFDARV